MNKRASIEQCRTLARMIKTARAKQTKAPEQPVQKKASYSSATATLAALLKKRSK